MRIGIDYRPAQKKNSRRRGLGRYTGELVNAMLAFPGKESDILLYCLKGERPCAAGGFEVRELSYIRKPSRLNWIKDRFSLPHRTSADSLDIFLATEINAIPGRSSCFVSAVVHDLIPFLFWEETRKSVPLDFLWALKSARKQIILADLIIADSEHTRQDICRLLEIEKSKVEVVYLGKSDTLEYVSADQARHELAEAGLCSGPFLFYVGGSDYRKNVGQLISFFSLVRSRGYEGKLVLGGETFLWDIPEISRLKSQIAGQGLAEDIVFPGYIPDSLLSRYYAACDFFVFPSLYEGFGLPVLEAMQCGAPLLLSRASSIPEVAGDGAFYFNPESLESMETAFFSAVGDPDLVAENIKKGLRRAGEFTWEKAASKIYSLYSQS
ncbi:MAG: glycosyltransferase family 1 protein [Acidobacteriota bacterium]